MERLPLAARTNTSTLRRRKEHYRNRERRVGEIGPGKMKWFLPDCIYFSMKNAALIHSEKEDFSFKRSKIELNKQG